MKIKSEKTTQKNELWSKNEREQELVWTTETKKWGRCESVVVRENMLRSLQQQVVFMPPVLWIIGQVGLAQQKSPTNVCVASRMWVDASVCGNEQCMYDMILTVGSHDSSPHPVQHTNRRVNRIRQQNGRDEQRYVSLPPSCHGCRMLSCLATVYLMRTTVSPDSVERTYIVRISQPSTCWESSRRDSRDDGCHASRFERRTNRP